MRGACTVRPTSQSNWRISLDFVGWTGSDWLSVVLSLYRNRDMAGGQNA